MFLAAPQFGDDDFGWSFHPLGADMATWLEVFDESMHDGLGTVSMLRPAKQTPKASFFKVNTTQFNHTYQFKKTTIADARAQWQSSCSPAAAPTPCSMG